MDVGPDLYHHSSNHWATVTGHLQSSLKNPMVFPASYLPAPQIGSWDGGRVREAMDRASMAPKMGVSSQLLSLMSTLGGGCWRCLVNSLSGQ